MTVDGCSFAIGRPCSKRLDPVKMLRHDGLELILSLPHLPYRHSKCKARFEHRHSRHLSVVRRRCFALPIFLLCQSRDSMSA